MLPAVAQVALRCETTTGVGIATYRVAVRESTRQLTVAFEADRVVPMSGSVGATA